MGSLRLDPADSTVMTVEVSTQMAVHRSTRTKVTLHVGHAPARDPRDAGRCGGAGALGWDREDVQKSSEGAFLGITRDGMSRTISS